MILTLMVQNLQAGGIRTGDGTPENRWPQLSERIKSAQPDLLLLTEAVDWNKYGQRYLAQAMNDLDMDALPLSPSKSGYGVGLLYKKETVGRWQRWNTDFVQETVHGFGVAGFEVGLPNLLSVVPVHLNPFGADKALEEAALVANRAYRHGPFAIIGGDINYAPAHGLAPNYNEMLPYNVAMRTELHGAAEKLPLTPDRRIGQKFEQAGFVDVAYHMFEATKDEKYLAFTCKQDRIDQFWVSKPLASAIVGYHIVDAPVGASDHAGVVFQLDTEKIDTSTSWEYR